MKRTLAVQRGILPDASWKNIFPKAALACLFALLSIIGLQVASDAAEIRLRKQCRPTRPVVTLADVADIVAVDPDEIRRLESIELFPAPAQRSREYLRVSELQDLLLLRGVDLSRCHFSGYGQIIISGLAPKSGADPPSDSVVRRAERKAVESITDYLKRLVDPNIPWSVKLALEAEQTPLIDRSRAIRISGGRSPWTGMQNFSLTVSTPEGIRTLDVAAKVTTPQAVVVAARTLGRGQLLGPASVELRVIDDRSVAGKTFSSIESIIGKELTTTVSVGRPILTSNVRSPIMVMRGDVVTVHSRCGGITVKTEGRARDAGGMGDLISVETIGRRETFHARVCGQRQVEIYARGHRVDRSRPSGIAGNYTTSSGMNQMAAGFSPTTNTGLTLVRQVEDSNAEMQNGTTVAAPNSDGFRTGRTAFRGGGIGSAATDDGLILSRQ